MPPEALNDSKDSHISLTFAKAWDVYSYAILIASVFIRDKVPYPGMANRAVMVQVQHRFDFYCHGFDFLTRLKLVCSKVLVHNMRPERPNVMSEGFYAFLTELWHQDPSERPEFDQVLERLDELKGNELSTLGEAYVNTLNVMETHPVRSVTLKLALLLCRYLMHGDPTTPSDMSETDSLGQLGDKTHRPKRRAKTVGMEDLQFAVSRGYRSSN